MDVRILDTTFRDGAQSLWAMAIRHGMMEPLAADMDRAGFAVIEVPAEAIDKFCARIIMTLWTALLEAVYCRKRTDLPA